jgi:hypothetical protein
MLREILINLKKSNSQLRSQATTQISVDSTYISKIVKNKKLVSKSHLEALPRIDEWHGSKLTLYRLAEKTMLLSEKAKNSIGESKSARDQYQQ